MSENISERLIREWKREQLAAMGIEPYAQRYNKQVMIAVSVDKHGAKLEEGSTSPFRSIEEILDWPQTTVQTAGRLTLFRTHGKLSFGRLMDESGEIQLMWHRDVCNLVKIIDGEPQAPQGEIENHEGETITAYKFLDKYVDVGDFLWVQGELFYTHKGELTLFVHSFSFLSKAIEPLGDKWHGVAGQETAYRQRYLDMVHNRETLERMKVRSQFLRTLREFYHGHEFMELDTAILNNAASGTAASPFTTHHNDYDLDVFLRIALEIPQKMATVGMLERTFEIGKVFRNEGSDPSHMQEFTSVEHYAAYWNYEDNMRFTEEMFNYLFDNIPSFTKVVRLADKEWVERDIDFTTPWQRVDYSAQVLADSGIDVTQYDAKDEEALRAEIKKQWHSREWLDVQTTATMIDYLYKKVTRPQIIGPAFIYNYPKTMQPLARTSDSNGAVVEQWQLLVNGWELIKAYGELVDPVKQQENFDEQADALARGDDEATAADDEFVTAMNYGMPPQSWRWMGIDRVLTILTQQTNIRDVVMFPLMKPLQPQSSDTGTEKENETIALDSSPTIIMDTISRDQVAGLIDKYITDSRWHVESVWQVMEHFANQLWEDADYWYAVGALHDIDWDYIEKDASKHMTDDFNMMMDEIDASQQMRDDIRSHGSKSMPDMPAADTLIRKYLICADELSGLMYAYARMRPEGFNWMKAKSIVKKVKDKSFAAGVDREHVRLCETVLDIPLSEFIAQMIEGMQGIEV